jgi:putative nucleotidyltransferase with HDIG domain
MRAAMRRKDEIRRNRFSQQLAVVLLIITAILAMLVTLYSGKGSILGLYDPSTLYQEGQLADEDFYATKGFEFVDLTAAKKLAQQQRSAVLPLFSYQIRPTVQSRDLLDSFIALFGKQDISGVESLLTELGLTDRLRVTRQISLLAPNDQALLLAILEESADHVLTEGLFLSSDLMEVEGEGYHRLDYTSPSTGKTERAISQDLYTKDNLHLSLNPWLAGYGSTVAAQIPLSLIGDTLSLLLQENIHYDRIETMRLRDEAAASIVAPTYTIERGTKLIGRDTVVTASQLDMLKYMQEHAFGYSILELIGRSLFILIATIVSVIVFLRIIEQEKRTYLSLNFLLVSIILSLIAMHFVTVFLRGRSLPLVDGYLPLYFAPLFIAHITSHKRLGYITAFLLACYATLMGEATLMTFFFVLGINAITLHFFNYSIKRLEDLFNWFYATAIASVAALAFSPLSGIQIHSFIPLIGSVVVNITLSVIIVEAFVPLVERLFNIPTAYRLNELAFSDSPIIERLSAVAQGTYNHSRYVSELAYQAAKAIGANAMLARVGGLYHDIGKADHPEYFMENQSGENKHDDIKPSLSVAVIKSHVKLGLEKGREAGLPLEVLDIIAQHHGNDVIQYFYSEATKQARVSGSEINIDDYSYAGDPPTFVESAIVMLADVVEAATRTLKQPSYSKYQKLIHSLVMGKIERGQLNDSGLSLTDLNRIEESFVQTLIGRDHQRIEYPEEQ